MYFLILNILMPLYIQPKHWTPILQVSNQSLVSYPYRIKFKWIFLFVFALSCEQYFYEIGEQRFACNKLSVNVSMNHVALFVKV